jgi:hypothetical protein
MAVLTDYHLFKKKPIHLYTMAYFLECHDELYLHIRYFLKKIHKQMKTILFSVILLMITLSGASAQSSESEVVKEFYKADGHISIVLNYIPQGWKFAAVEDRFEITSPDTVWVLEENRINAAPENKEDQIRRIKAKGTRVIPEIIIRYENKWSPEKIQQSKIFNATIDDKINKLPQKYDIVQLLDKKLSTKNQIVYTGSNDKEKRLIEQYENEKITLEKGENYHA